ncbi:MAG: hypothetical protein D6762_07005 [Candidatus Neomarinimicrobiota bacterium]|nr:MAG: hypothetical protein D6762_07005 [Candidatus Neomarinimicrobiota bacterium]
MKAQAIILIIPFLFLPTFGQQKSDVSLYKKAWQTAASDGKITRDERALLDLLAKSFSIPPDSLRTIEILPDLASAEHKPDQSGRWPLVLQNMVIGSGLYGWAIPYVLNVMDTKWLPGMEMLSLGGSFYLTYQTTKKMDIPHSRAQMMRYGGLAGLRYGFGINTVFDLYESTATENSRKGWAYILMASVPAGMYIGDRLYKKLHPTNGQAWMLTGWTAVGGISMRILANFFDPDPGYGVESVTQTEAEWRQLDREKQTRNRTHTALELLVGYPAGFWVGKQLTMQKNYSFGDALMLYQGYAFGFFNTMALQSLLFNEGTEKNWLLVNGIGAVSGILLYDKWIAHDDFTAGQSILMALGSGSGIMFGFGTAIILDIQNVKSMMALVLSGYTAGTILTRRILDVKPDGSLTGKEQKKFAVMPTVFPVVSGSKTTWAPGLAVNVEL